MVRLFISLLLLITILLGSVVLYVRYQDWIILERSPIQTARQLLDNQEYAAASLWADWIIEQDNNSFGSVAQAQQLKRDIQQQLDQSRLGRYLKGMVGGEPEGMASLLGSVTLDLFVVGDVRDLVVQGYKKYSDQPSDDFVMALSAIGLATTIVPEIDWAPAMMKGFKKTAAFSELFVKSTSKVASKALRTRQFKPLVKVCSDFATVVKNLGPGPAKQMMKVVDSPSDMARLSRWVGKDANSTFVLLSDQGKNGFKALSKSPSVLKTVGKRIKVFGRFSRILKTGYKSISILPNWLICLIIIFCSMVLFGWRLFFPRKKHRVRQERTF